MKVGLRVLDDTIFDVNNFKNVKKEFGDKQYILERIYKKDCKALRKISNYFYEANGIYQRLCRYLAFLYRYDWYVTTFCDNIEQVKQNKVTDAFKKVLAYFDNSNIKKMFGDIALEIMISGNYYGYILDSDDKFSIQQLPSEYCRSRYFQGTSPVVELNMQFFDNQFPNANYRMRILSLFPKDIQKAYVLFKQGKLLGDYPGDKKGWYVLDPAASVKFSLNNKDFPPLIAVIPSIIDLDNAQELDRKKTMQQLLKILVQKLPLDKNGDLIFDPDEAKDVHNMAVQMLQRAVGVDVLTTFADIIKIDTKDSNAATTKDDLEKVERTVFNNSGVTRNLFNADGNLAVTNSILNDEASIKDLILQFQILLNTVIIKFNKKNHYSFRASILETTQYNYKELSKFYKEQVQLGNSKVLPQVALGHSQSSIIAMAQFENEILHLGEIMLPPLSSNTISGQDLLGKRDQNQSQKTQKEQKIETKSAGRPEKEDSEKSDKTIQNKESMN